MDNYNLFADLLNKYSQLTPWVQALLGVGFFAVVLGVAYFTKETVATIMQPWQRPMEEAKPRQEWRDKYYRDDAAH